MIKEQLAALIKQYFTMKDISRTFKLLKPFLMRQWKSYLVIK